MKIEAVTVCVDYSHYLSKVISNKDQLDRWVIVTHESDKDTIQLCVDNDIEYVCSKNIFKNAKFAKGRAINEGLSILNKKDWILHLDADQKLPENFRSVVTSHCTSRQKLYGAYRYNIFNEKFPPVPLVLTKKNNNGEDIRYVKKLYIPIGYFQLWHSSKFKRYIALSKNTRLDDYKFILRWKSKNISKKKFRSNLVMLDLKLLDVCGYEGSISGHINGIRNLKQK
jgi:hypothetical protein